MTDLFGKKPDKGVMVTDNTLSKPVVKPTKKKRKPSKKTVKKKAVVREKISQSANVPTVPVTSVVIGRLIIKDAPSGQIYTFEHAGAVLPVRVQDIEHFRSKNRTEVAGKCCSSGGGTFLRRYFEIPD